MFLVLIILSLTPSHCYDKWHCRDHFIASDILRPSSHRNISILSRPRMGGWRVPCNFYLFGTKQCHCFDNFTQNTSFCMVLKMGPLHTHSREGGWEQQSALWTWNNLHCYTWIVAIPGFADNSNPPTHTHTSTQMWKHRFKWWGWLQPLLWSWFSWGFLKQI